MYIIKYRMITGTFTVLFVLFILACHCASSLQVLNNDVIEQYGLTDGDLEKYVYFINGEVIFYRLAESFDNRRSSAAEGVYGRQNVNDQFHERVLLKHNTVGFFHHRTDTHIYIQIKSGEYILPFDLSTGQLETPTIVVDGKQYEYEEGEATLVFLPKNGMQK